MEEDQKNQMVSADEASEITSLHVSTLRRMAWQRKIRSYKVLNALRFKRGDLEQLIVERPAVEKTED